MTDIARAEGLDGRQPVDLTADRLTKPRAIPIGWAGQRDDLGLD